MCVLRSRGTELEREFAFGVVRQLVEPPLAEASELERAELLQSTAGVAAALLGLPGAPDADSSLASSVDPSFAILHGLYWMCANLAGSRPVCMVIDDAHWADAPSLRFLAFLLTRLDELPIALIVATRPREVGTDADLLAAVMTDPSAEVDPHSSTDESRRGASRGGDARRRAGSRVRRRLPARDSGTPFLVRELVDALSEGGIAPIAEAASPRRANRRSDGRPLDRSQASPAGRARRAACAGARDPRAE